MSNRGGWRLPVVPLAASGHGRCPEKRVDRRSTWFFVMVFTSVYFYYLRAFLVFFPTPWMLRVSFSPAPECVDADCWKRFFRSLRGTRNTVIVVVIVFWLRILHYIYIYEYKVSSTTLGPKFYCQVFWTWNHLSRHAQTFPPGYRNLQECSHCLQGSEDKNINFQKNVSSQPVNDIFENHGVRKNNVRTHV